MATSLWKGYNGFWENISIVVAKWVVIKWHSCGDDSPAGASKRQENWLLVIHKWCLSPFPKFYADIQIMPVFPENKLLSEV